MLQKGGHCRGLAVSIHVGQTISCMLIYKGLITHLATGILPTHFIKNRQNPPKVEFQGIILKFSKRNKILLLLPQNAKLDTFPLNMKQSKDGKEKYKTG